MVWDLVKCILQFAWRHHFSWNTEHKMFFIQLNFLPEFFLAGRMTCQVCNIQIQLNLAHLINSYWLTLTWADMHSLFICDYNFPHFILHINISGIVNLINLHILFGILKVKNFFSKLVFRQLLGVFINYGITRGVEWRFQMTGLLEFF